MAGLNLAQRVAAEFKTLRDNELTLKANVADVMDISSFNLDYFEKTGDDITFKGNLIPDTDIAWSIGSPTNKLKDLYVSANTIHLGDSTTLAGTSITVDAGVNPTSVADTPTIVASALIAKPFTYDPGTGNVLVRPTIAFQDTLGNNYPISFDTVNNKFSFDALGNFGQGSVVAKNLELGGNLTLDGSFNLTGYTFSPTQLTVDGGLRVDGNTVLGYDQTSTVELRGTTSVKAPITFELGATLGDGNDNIVINSGAANLLTINALNITLNDQGVLGGVSITESQISDLQSYTLTNSKQVLPNGTALVLNTNSLELTKADGTKDIIDLTKYLDESSRSIASGVLDSVTGIVTYTRDDATTFTVDMSGLLDDTNLVTSVAGKNGVVTLQKADITDFSDADYATADQGTKADNALPLAGGTLTGKLTVQHGVNMGVHWPTDAFGGGSDTASITLQNPSGGENQELTLSMTNDPADIVHVKTPSNDGLKHNGAVVLSTSHVDASAGTAGDMLYHNGTKFVKLPKGTPGQVLTVDANGLPVWATPTIA